MADISSRVTDEGASLGSSMARTLGRQSALTFVALAVNGVARTVTSLLVGRLAGPIALGLFQAGVSAAQLAALFGPAALGSAASSFVARTKAQGDPDALDAVEGHLALRVLQSTLLVVPVAAVAWWAVAGRGAASTIPFAVMTLSFCLYSFSRGLLYGSGKATRAAHWSIATSLVGVAMVGVAVVLDVRGSMLLAIFAFSYLLFAVPNWTRASPRRLRHPLGREIDRFTLFAVLGTLASTGFLNTTMVMAAAVGRGQEVGQFSAAFVLATPASLIGASATLILFPLLSSYHAQGAGGERTRIVDLCSRSLAVTVVALFAMLLLLRQELVDVLWGPTFSSAARLLAPLLLALMLMTLAIPAVNALTTFSSRGVRLSAGSSLVGMLTGFAAWAFLIPHSGITGVAYGFLFGSVISSVVPFVLTWRATGQSWGRHSLQLAGASICLGALCYVQQALDTGIGTNLVILAVFLAGWTLVTWSDCRLVLVVLGRTLSRS